MYSTDSQQPTMKPGEGTYKNNVDDYRLTDNIEGLILIKTNQAREMYASKGSGEGGYLAIVPRTHEQGRKHRLQKASNSSTLH